MSTPRTMSTPRLDIVILGLSITSSWGNGHATTYRALVRALGARGHDVTFLERDRSWYADNRDLPKPPGCTTRLYRGIGELERVHARRVRDADVVIVGSFVPQHYYPDERPLRWDLGYLGTYSADRQPVLERLLVEPARSWKDGRFIVAGPQYPDTIRWARNVRRRTHLPPRQHRAFYNAQR